MMLDVGNSAPGVLMLRFGFVLFSSFACLSAAPLVAQSWPVGVEREVDEGVYMKVVAVQSGWRIWRSETKSGVACKAVKSAKGRPHPEPVGVSWAMWNGTPFLEVTWSDYFKKIQYNWKTVHYGRVKMSYRKPGDRFWTDATNSTFDPASVGESTIELTISSWEYPEILVGRAEEEALFELSGLGWAQEQVRSCQGVPV
jgi:hypothetical protein